MHSLVHHRPSPVSSPRHLGIQDHPVFQALPPVAQQQALIGESLMVFSPGEAVPDDGGLYFVLTGVIGLFPHAQRICVSAVVAGSVLGWDQALDVGARQLTARALIETLVCRVPAECVLAPLGRDWHVKLVARQALIQTNLLATEAACNASHLVTERLAKWLVRLYCGANGAPLRLTQADFAAMLGVQRTSVNAAALRLREQGLARFGRGVVQVVDLAGLRKTSCGCGEPPAKRTRSVEIAPASHRAQPASWTEVADTQAAFRQVAPPGVMPAVTRQGAHRHPID